MTTVTSVYNINDDVAYTTLNGTLLGYGNPSRDIALDYEWNPGSLQPALTRNESQFQHLTIRFMYEGTSKGNVNELVSADYRKMNRSQITLSDGFVFDGAIEKVDTDYKTHTSAEVTYTFKGQHQTAPQVIHMSPSERITPTILGDARVPCQIRFTLKPGTYNSLKFDWGIGVGGDYLLGYVDGTLGGTFYTNPDTFIVNGITGAVTLTSGTTVVHFESIYSRDLPSLQGGAVNNIYVNDTNDVISSVTILYAGRWL